MKRDPRTVTKLVPVPSTNIIPERDVGKSPILECRHLGVDFGGLTAVEVRETRSKYLRAQ